MHKTVVTFVFKKKKEKSQGFFIFLCTGFHENRQRSNLLFSLRESKRGSYIFPADPRMNHHSQVAVGDNVFSRQIYI